MQAIFCNWANGPNGQRQPRSTELQLCAAQILHLRTELELCAPPTLTGGKRDAPPTHVVGPARPRGRDQIHFSYENERCNSEPRRGVPRIVGHLVRVPSRI